MTALPEACTGRTSSEEILKVHKPTVLDCLFVTSRLSGVPSLEGPSVLRKIQNIFPFFWNDHAHLHIHNGGEISRFLEVVEAAHLHQLAHDLIGYLVAPIIDNRHVDVVYEDAHLLARRRPVGRPHPLVDVTLDGFLRVKSTGISRFIRKSNTK